VSDAMAVALEYLSIVVPIRKIDRCKSLGGFRGFLRSQGFPGLGAQWHDEFLFREGAMNATDIEVMIAVWKNRGLKPTRREDGSLYWKDLCVIDCFNGSTLPCRWIEVDLKNRCAWLKNTPKGEICGPGGMANE
jgi:hypothetical protein